MPRLWYPTRRSVETVAHRLAAELFEDYDSALPAFSLLGGERGGGALLDSALALPKQTFDGRPLYRTVYDKAAVLLRSIIKNHPFIDGNKRLGLATAAAFLLMNGYVLIASPDEMVNYALEIAKSEPGKDWREISRWIRQHAISIRDPNKAFAQIKAGYWGQTELLRIVLSQWKEILSL